MSANSSASDPPPPFVTVYLIMYGCFRSTVGSFNFTVFTTIAILLLLPSCIFVLYLGFQRWWQQGYSSVTTSNSDVFTFHMTTMELIRVLGSVLVCCGTYARVDPLIRVGNCLFCLNIPGQLSLHSFTCVDRYLAVVHPVTYLSLKNERCARIRDGAIGSIWLLSIAWTLFSTLEDQVNSIIVTLCLVSFGIIVVLICSLLVLCVLTRPGPGRAGGARPKVDQSKQKAFHTIAVILGLLLVNFGGKIITFIVLASPQIGSDGKCMVMSMMCWLNLPSSLVLPLLFLLRAGKLPCRRNNSSSGW
ncbi:uncharacterized protein V6R79_024596 [Siganus canaliculatus]